MKPPMQDYTKMQEQGPLKEGIKKTLLKKNLQER